MYLCVLAAIEPHVPEHDSPTEGKNTRPFGRNLDSTSMLSGLKHTALEHTQYALNVSMAIQLCDFICS